MKVLDWEKSLVESLILIAKEAILDSKSTMSQYTLKVHA